MKYSVFKDKVKSIRQNQKRILVEYKYKGKQQWCVHKSINPHYNYSSSTIEALMLERPNAILKISSQDEYSGEIDSFIIINHIV